MLDDPSFNVFVTWYCRACLVAAFVGFVIGLCK